MAGVYLALPVQATLQDWQGYYRLLREGDYLGAMRLLEQGTGGNEDIRQQDLAVVYGAVGRFRQAQETYNRYWLRNTPEAPASPTEAELMAVRQTPLQPADQLVIEAVKRRRIVILNESHHQPEHRAFGASLLPRLKAVGLKYLAIEADRQEPLDEAMRTGQVLTDTDYYSFEPRRAALLRAAIRAGLKVVAFDIRTPDLTTAIQKDPARAIPLREEAMARTIDLRIIRRDPTAKALIWVGMGHACKQPLDAPPPLGKQSFMARRLWQRTGIEPFSIYQISDSGDPRCDDPLYRLVVKAARRRLDRPMAILFPLDSYLRPIPNDLRRHPIYSRMIECGVDAVILHPPQPVAIPHQRPAWLLSRGAAQIQGVVLKEGRPIRGCLVQALLTTDGDRGAPIDQTLTDADGRYSLNAPAGRYRLRVWAPAERPGAERIVAAKRVQCRTYHTIRWAPLIE